MRVGVRGKVGAGSVGDEDKGDFDDIQGLVDGGWEVRLIRHSDVPILQRQASRYSAARVGGVLTHPLDLICMDCSTHPEKRQAEIHLSV